MPGVRQIAARAKAAAANRLHRPSLLAGLLVKQMIHHSLTPSLAQQIAAAALQDMATEREFDCTTELRKLSSLGSFGTAPNHGRKQLFNSVLCKPDLKSTRMKIPLKDIANAHGYTMEFQDLFLPHLWVHQMWTYYRDSWTRLVCASQEIMRSFWDAMEPSPFLDGAHIKPLHGYKERVVPLWCHGDGVATVGVGKSWSRMMDCISFGSLLVSIRSFDMSWMAWTCFKSAQSKVAGVGDTMQTFWNIMKWSFEAAYEGRFPHHDHNGVPYVAGTTLGDLAGTPLAALPDGTFLRAMLFGNKQDLDFLARDMGLRNYSAAEPCNWCPATKYLHNVPWYDFRSDADWVQLVFNKHSYALARGAEGYPLMRPSWMNCCGVWPDKMHTKHLGCDKYLAGSTLWLLAFEILDGSPDENVAFIWSEIKAFYTAHSYSRRKWSTFKTLRLGMFTSVQNPFANFPELKGKAAMISHVMPALLSILQEHYDQAVGYDETRRVKQYDLCAPGGWRLCPIFFHIKHFFIICFLFVQNPKHVSCLFQFQNLLQNK